MSAPRRLLASIFGFADPKAVTVGAGLSLTDNELSAVMSTIKSAYAAGTAYALTNTAAALVFGTTSPVITLDAVGTYLVFGNVHLKLNAATTVAETLTVKMRRTNNTAADLAAGRTITPTAGITATGFLGVIPLPPVVYTTPNADDSITLFGNVSATLGAGTIDAISAELIAIRVA